MLAIISLDKNLEDMEYFFNESDISEPVDYKKKPQNYCGMDITDNPFYDL